MVEAKFIPNDRKNIWVPLRPDILPGKTGAWEDRSSGIGRFIFAHCLEDNSGASIHMVDPENAGVQADLLIADLNDDNRLCEIYAGHSCQIEIVDCDDEEGLLVLQHIGYKGLRQVYN